jgi:hypothetical protein
VREVRRDPAALIERLAVEGVLEREKVARAVEACVAGHGNRLAAASPDRAEKRTPLLGGGASMGS